MSDTATTTPEQAEENRRWAASLTPADIELGIHAALKAHDMRAVVDFLRLLATKDPHRAQLLLDVVDVARAMRAEDPS